MLKGYNTDITVSGVRYHVQTEDWGVENPFLVTRIFRNGAVVKSYKASYEKALRSGPVSMKKALAEALKKQHTQILDLLQSGQLKQ